MRFVKPLLKPDVGRCGSGTDQAIYEKGLKILCPQRSVEDGPKLLASSTLAVAY